MKVAFPLVASIIVPCTHRSLLRRSEPHWWYSLVWMADHLGVDGISTGSLLVMEGLVTAVELTGMCPCTVGVALLVKLAGTRLSIGKAEISSAGRFELKGC